MVTVCERWSELLQQNDLSCSKAHLTDRTVQFKMHRSSMWIESRGRGIGKRCNSLFVMRRNWKRCK